MNPLHTTLTLTALCAASLGAQQTTLFVPSMLERTASHSSGTSLQSLGTNEIAIVTHDGACAVSAEKFAPLTAYNAMAGDEDGDGSHWNPTLLGTIDAILVSSYLPAGSTNLRTTWVSVSAPTGACVAGTRLRPGDVGAIVHVPGVAGGNGVVELFLSAEQVKAALGTPAAVANIDVDAIAQDSAGNLLLSLAVAVNINVFVPGAGLTAMVLDDGAVFMIPASAITYAADGTVAAVANQRAIVVRSEAQIDAMVFNAVVARHNGTRAVVIDDLTGLDIALGGGSFVVPWGTAAVTVPHFAFTGEQLSGLVILETTGGGTRMPIFGCAPSGTMFGAGASTGDELGVDTVAGPSQSFIQALELLPTEPLRFVTGTSTPTPAPGAPLSVDLGAPGAAGASAVLFLSFAPTAACMVEPVFLSWTFTPTSAFPEVYKPDLVIGPIAIDALGFGTFSLPGGGPLGNYLFQAAYATAAGSVEFSSPTTIEIR